MRITINRTRIYRIKQSVNSGKGTYNKVTVRKHRTISISRNKK